MSVVPMGWFRGPAQFHREKVAEDTRLTHARAWRLPRKKTGAATFGCREGRAACRAPEAVPTTVERAQKFARRMSLAFQLRACPRFYSAIRIQDEIRFSSVSGTRFGNSSNVFWVNKNLTIRKSWPRPTKRLAEVGYAPGFAKRPAGTSLIRALTARFSTMPGPANTITPIGNFKHRHSA